MNSGTASIHAVARRHGSRVRPRVVALVLSVLCLALNAFFVAAEFALVKVHVTQLDRALRRGDRRAHAAKAVLGRLDRYLSVTQFGITVASLGLGWIGEPALEHAGDRIALALTGEALGSVGHVLVDVLGLGLLTFLHLLLGELVPKFVALQHAEATTLNAAIPLRFVNAVFFPILWVLERAQRAVLRLIHVNPDVANEGALSEDEIIGILAASAARTGHGRDKQRIVERVLHLTRRPVRQIMVPRVDVVSLAIDASPARAREVLRQHEFSRVLLVNDAIDEVAGYLYAKDLLLADDVDHLENLRPLARSVLFIPEMQDGLSALREMQRNRASFAVVVDEYGGTSGIITLEDLVEEIVGDIRDELDVEPAAVVRVPGEPETWDVDARATVDELRDAGVPLDAEEHTFGEAIGTLVYNRLGHLPRSGDVVKLAGDVAAEVISTGRRRIQRLRVRVDHAAALAT
jgi:CBS domain containing-hemolysin-like protein